MKGFFSCFGLDFSGVLAGLAALTGFSVFSGFAAFSGAESFALMRVTCAIDSFLIKNNLLRDCQVHFSKYSLVCLVFSYLFIMVEYSLVVSVS